MSRSTLAGRVRDAIKAYIVSENLEPGASLPSERQLSEVLGVSRNIVREGLSALVAEGIIVKQPGKGIFLREVDRDTLHRDGTQVLEQEQARYAAIREARGAVELGAMGLIVHRITDVDLRELEAITDVLEMKLERGEPIASDDMQFHIRLLRTAGNDILLQWSPLVEEVMRGWAYQAGALPQALRSPRQSQESRRVVQEHRAILEALRRRDVHGARECLRRHLLIPDL